MGTLQSNRVSLHIDSDRLRRCRLQKQWTQHDLAQATGFCDDYISQLERAPTTRNKGTKLETLVKLAQHLNVCPADLLAEDVFRQLEADVLLHEIYSNVDTVRLFRSISSTGDVTEKAVVFRIDPEKLREARLRKSWTQRDLARASRFSEDYISQLERAATTHNKGTRFETLLRLAQALEIAPVDLLTENLSEALQVDMTRRELLDHATSLGIVGLLYGKTPSAPRHSAFPFSLSSIELPAEPVETVAELRRKATFLAVRGLWLQAEEIGLQARSRCKEGSEEWVDITINHCAQMRQQAGDILQAEAHVKHVIQHAVAVDRADTRILALIHTQRGWFACEQFGNYEQGYRYFTSALQKALKVGDAQTASTAYHFRFRILSELVMREGGAWLEARPVRSVNQQLLRMLHQSLNTDWPLSCDDNSEDLHAMNRRFIAYALIQPGKALKEIPKLISISKSIGAEHVVDLTIARWHLSNEEWDMASSLAHQAFHGYCRAAFPQGIALAAAVRAEALFQNRLRTKEDCNLCLDLWLLALLLHPYESHPLWDIARKGLRKAIECICKLNPNWYRAYYHEINERVERKDGAFQALQYIYINTSWVMPTQYLDLLKM